MFAHFRNVIHDALLQDEPYPTAREYAEKVSAFRTGPDSACCMRCKTSAHVRTVCRLCWTTQLDSMSTPKFERFWMLFMSP